MASSPDSSIVADLPSDSDASSTLHQRVSNLVITAIRNARYRPGDKLPTESALARQMGLNRLTVRRGYMTLKERGIIVQQRGAGSFVADGALNVLGVEPGKRLRNVAFAYNQDMYGGAEQIRSFIVLALLRGISDRLQADGVRLCHVPIDVNRQPIGQELEAQVDPYDGVILQGDIAMRLPEQMLMRLRDQDIPVVSALMPSPMPWLPSVYYDRRRATYLAADHLAQCGCRRIGFVGRLHGGNSESKLAGFLAALRDHDLDLLSRDQIQVGAAPGEAYSAALQLLKGNDLPDGLLVDTDIKAMELVRALHDHGVRVPDDIQVVSYDNMPESGTFDPPLTTIKVPRDEIGRIAAQMLAEWPRNGSRPESVVLQPELIVRASTRPAGSEADA